VRDDRPFGGKDPPGVMFYYTRDRTGVHPQRQLARFCGVLQADAYSGYDALYAAGRKPGLIVEAAFGRTDADLSTSGLASKAPQSHARS
jgi:transposase